MVLGAPALHERHADGTHLRQLIYRFESMIDSLGHRKTFLKIKRDKLRSSANMTSMIDAGAIGNGLGKLRADFALNCIFSHFADIF